MIGVFWGLLPFGPGLIRKICKVAYGADFLPSGPLDPALRDAFDVRCFLARQALLRRNFLLLSTNALDTATCLAALSEVKGIVPQNNW